MAESGQRLGICGIERTQYGDHQAFPGAPQLGGGQPQRLTVRRLQPGQPV